MSRIHAMDGEVPAGPGLFEVNGHDPQNKLITNVRRVAGAERTPGSLLIGISTGLLALLGAGCFYVSWWGQYLFIFAAKAPGGPRADPGRHARRGDGHPVRAVARAGPAGQAVPGGAGADPAVRRRVGRDELPGRRRRLAAVGDRVHRRARLRRDHHRPGGVGGPQARAGDQRGVRVAGAGPGGGRPGPGHGAAGAVLAAVRPRAAGDRRGRAPDGARRRAAAGRGGGHGRAGHGTGHRPDRPGAGPGAPARTRSRPRSAPSGRRSSGITGGTRSSGTGPR